jgi:hypothetical protein
MVIPTPSTRVSTVVVGLRNEHRRKQVRKGHVSKKVKGNLPGSMGAHQARSTIGFLSSTISEYTGQTLLSGIADAARKFDLNLICFPGRCLNDPRDFQAQSNILYNLANAQTVLGVVSWASSIGTYVTPEANVIFHEHFLPLVWPKTPSVFSLTLSEHQIQFADNLE